MNEIDVLIPVAATRTKRGKLASRLETVPGHRLGLLDNLKANAGELLKAVVEILRGKGHAFETFTATKNATVAAPDAVMAHLMQCEAVILAIAD